MAKFQSDSRSKTSRPVLIAAITLFVIGASIIAIFYGDQVVAFATGQILGNSDVRIQKRVALFEQEFSKPGRSASELLELVESARKIVQLLEKENPAQSEVYYYYSLLNFYEVLIRVPLNGSSLLRLTGRGYLPDSPEGLGLPPISIAALSGEAATMARKSLAIEPKPSFESRLKVAMSLGELLSTGRTDPHLLSVVQSIKKDELTRSMTDSNDWLRWALFALQGKSSDLEAELNERKMLQEIPGAPAAPDAKGIEHLQLDINEARLLLSHACFNGKDYIRALNFARQVKFNPTAAQIWKVDAARMEGEIFLLQNGKDAARGYFEEALKLSEGKDKLIQERLNSLSPQGKPVPVDNRP